MKKLMLSLLVLSTCFIAYSQNILIADNNAGAPSGTHVYGTLQEAIDATVAGDIIHVIPSPTNYGTVTIGETQGGISMFGIGFNPDKDGPATSDVGVINILSSDVRLSGLNVTDRIDIGEDFSGQSINNVAVENCKLARLTTATTTFTASNILIRNCLISVDPNTNNTAIYLSSSVSNSVITNCIIGGRSDTGTSIGSIDCHNGGVIKNNIFVGDGEANKNSFGEIANCTVSNNIFFGREPRWLTSMNNVIFNNNVSAGGADNSLPPKTTDGVSGNNNYTNLTDATMVFEDITIVIGDEWNLSWLPILTSANQSSLLGNDGTEIGPTGSTLGWDPTGVPLPLIQSVISSEVIKQGDNLDVTVKARGN